MAIAMACVFPLTSNALPSLSRAQGEIRFLCHCYNVRNDGSTRNGKTWRREDREQRPRWGSGRDAAAAREQGSRGTGSRRPLQRPFRDTRRETEGMNERRGEEERKPPVFLDTLSPHRAGARGKTHEIRGEDAIRRWHEPSLHS